MKFFKLILSPITGPIKFIITAGLLVASVVFTYQHGWWSFTDFLPGWQPYSETEYHHIPDSVLVGAIWQNDGVLIGGSAQVYTTDSLYVKRYEGYMDNEPDFMEVREYGARATLAVKASDVNIVQSPDQIVFQFRNPYIFSVELLPNEEKLLKQGWAAAIMPPSWVPEFEGYRKSMRDRTRKRMYELSQYTPEKRGVLYTASAQTLKATIVELLGTIDSTNGQRPIVVSIE